MLNREFINEQNPWWTDAVLIKSDEKIKTAMGNKPNLKYVFPLSENLIILGSRQVGKTTFMKLAISDLLTNKKIKPQNVLFFSCEALSNKDDIIELAQYFDEISDKRARRYLFLDEITFVDDWNVALLSLFNSGYLADKTIWVTGSSSVSLQKETLPGRKIRKMHFYPLSFRDYVDLFHGKQLAKGGIDIDDINGIYSAAKGLMPHIRELNRYLESYAFVTGGMLATSYCFFRDGQDPFDQYYETYKDAVLSDLPKLGLSERTFRETLYGLFASYGSRYSSNGIAAMTSIGSHKTVEVYIDTMEKLFILNTVFKKENGRIIYRSNRKGYFADPFIYRVLRFYSTGAKTIRESEKPAMLEGVVGSALIRRYGEKVNYMHTKNGKEVDFVVGKIGIEVKYGAAKPSDLNSGAGYLVTRKGDLLLEKKKLLLPASIFMYLL